MRITGVPIPNAAQFNAVNSALNNAINSAASGNTANAATGAANSAANAPATGVNGVASGSGVQAPSSPGDVSFGEMVKKNAEDVNELQHHADDLSNKLATGEIQDVHQTLLAIDQAGMAFGLTVQVRNKALDAYQEIMHMQV
jgi:flagellar hook-basal body complex protein FliE